MTLECGWLIEINPGPFYWNGSCFSADHMSAVRFARKVDAERVIRTAGFKTAKAVEHGWE